MEKSTAAPTMPTRTKKETFRGSSFPITAREGTTTYVNSVRGVGSRRLRPEFPEREAVWWNGDIKSTSGVHATRG